MDAEAARRLGDVAVALVQDARDVLELGPRQRRRRSAHARHRALERLHELQPADRLLHEVHGAAVERVDDVLHVAVPGQEHDQQIGQLRLQVAQQIDPRVLADAQVDERAVGPARARDLTRALGRRRRQHGEPARAQIALERREQDRVVIDDEDGAQSAGESRHASNLG